MKTNPSFSALNSCLRAATFSVAAFFAVTSGTVLAGEVVVNYDYAQNHGVDFSTTKGALKLGEFRDARDVNDPHLLTANDGGYSSKQALPAIVKDALIQAFEDGGASLVTSDEQLLLSGEVRELTVAEKDSGIEATLRVNVVLEKAGQTLWQNVLFGKASVADYENLDQAIRGSLDQLIENLVWDDYFLMHVI